MMLGQYQPYKGYVYSAYEEHEEDNRKLWHEFYKSSEMEEARKELREPEFEFRIDYNPYEYLTEEQFHKAVDNYENKQSK